jgi:hypothetical protein
MKNKYSNSKQSKRKHFRRKYSKSKQSKRKHSRRKYNHKKKRKNTLTKKIYKQKGGKNINNIEVKGPLRISGVNYYVFRITTSDRIITVGRRYSDFEEFHSQLKSQFRDVSSRLPGKIILNREDPIKLEARRVGLERYLNDIKEEIGRILESGGGTLYDFFMEGVDTGDMVDTGAVVAPIDTSVEPPGSGEQSSELSRTMSDPVDITNMSSKSMSGQKSPVDDLPSSPILRIINPQQIWLTNKLLPLQESAILKYTGPTAYSINRFLRKEIYTINSNMENIICKLDEVFESIPPLETEITVYRGVNFGESQMTSQINLISKRENKFNEFLSTSIDRNAAMEFTPSETTFDRWDINPHSSPRTARGFTPYCCLFVITIPPGNRVLPILQGSVNPDESEILLPRNCILITDRKTTEMIGGRPTSVYYQTLQGVDNSTDDIDCD